MLGANVLQSNTTLIEITTLAFKQGGSHALPSAWCLFDSQFALTV